MYRVSHPCRIVYSFLSQQSCNPFLANLCCQCPRFCPLVVLINLISSHKDMLLHHSTAWIAQLPCAPHSFSQSRAVWCALDKTVQWGQTASLTVQCAGQGRGQHTRGRAECYIQPSLCRGTPLPFHAAAAVPRSVLLRCQQLSGAAQQGRNCKGGVLPGAWHHQQVLLVHHLLITITTVYRCLSR